MKDDADVTVIAEIGCNHQGSMDTAREMIRAAYLAGAPAVKLQKRDIDSMPEEQLSKPYTGPHSFGPTYGEHRRALEFTPEQHAELAALARSYGMLYGLSFWDEVSIVHIDRGAVDFVKVPSAKSHDSDFVVSLMKQHFGTPVLISFGMSERHNVVVTGAAALANQRQDIYAMQCTSAYPVENKDVHLRVIPWLRGVLPWTGVGFSGHHRGTHIDVQAVTLGATIIERHFTLDRTMRGTDHAASLEPRALAELVGHCRAAVAALGDSAKRVLDCERPAMEKLRGVA